MCTAGVHQYTGVSLTKFARGWHCKALHRSVFGFVALVLARVDTSM